MQSRAVALFTRLGIVSSLFLAAAAAGQSSVGLEQRTAQVTRAEPGRPLTAASRAAPANVVAGYLRDRGRAEAVLASLHTTRTSAGAHGMTHLRMEQSVAGLAVHGAYLKAAVNARGELVHLIDNLSAVSNPRAARINALGALKSAMARVHPAQAVTFRSAGVQGNTAAFNGGVFFHRPPEVSAVAIPMSDGTLARGWLVETWTRQANQLHHTLVGGDGQVVDVELRTASDTYRVFKIDPSKGAQTLESGPGGGNAESPIGWLAGAQTTLTIGGNNIVAYLDRNNDNLSDGGGDAAGVNFLTKADLRSAPTSATNQAVAVQNLFYLNNRIHDVLYRHGFTEAAGNFQASNFGKGGASGADPVQAEAQDGGGTDNANFATPRDGSAPRMQMYLWAGAGPTHQVLANRKIYNLAGSGFGPELTTTGVTGTVAPTIPADGCTAISALPNGSVALIDRGTCEFSFKVLNAQLAGASAVIIANNDLLNPDTVFAPGPGADAASVTIPSGMVSKNSGDALRQQIPVTATLSKLAIQPLQIDAALDSDVVYHEYCHGLTWRMIGRMSGPLAGAIGEGMADGCSLLVNSDNDVVGEYATSDPRGIRSAPYTNYPRSYADVAGTGVHFDGEVYAAIVWQLILDFGANRDKLFTYIVDGMNYTPANPVYEDMRDGILASVAASSTPSDCRLVWNAFAKYGVGVGAKGAVRGTRVEITESKSAPTTCN